MMFHTIDEKYQKLLTKDTQYCVVGDYLCLRHRDRQVIWVIKISDVPTH